MITGNGTADSHYVISGDDIRTVWNELLDVIKNDGVYVDLDKAYSFNPAVICEGTSVPGSIKIGRETVLNGSGSSIVSGGLKAETFDFSGTKAVILNFRTLAYKESPEMDNLIFVETYQEFIDIITSGEYSNTRVKLAPNIEVDYNDVPTETSIVIKPYPESTLVLQCENLTILNSRQFKLTVDNNKVSAYLYNIHIKDCYGGDNDYMIGMTGATTSAQSKKLYIYESKFKLYKTASSNSIDYFIYKGSGTVNTLSFYRCNITAFSGGNSQLTNANLCKDCNIVLDNVQLKQDMNLGAAELTDCHVYGSVNISTALRPKTGTLTNVILELKDLSGTGWSTTTGTSGRRTNVVINCSEGYLPVSELAAAGGVTFLTYEEIRDPEKLSGAGILTAPNGA